MALKWESQFETGEYRVDDQHKRLIDFINKLEEMMQAPTIRPDEADWVMSFLSMYVRVHFLYEETCMNKHKCAVAEKNKIAHEKFLEAFAGLKKRYERDGASKQILSDVHHAAKDWLVGHICKIDVTLRQHV